MISRRIGSCIVAVVLGVLAVAVPAGAGSVPKPCSVVSAGEVEAVIGMKVAKSLESDSLCERWLADGRTVFLALGPQAIKVRDTEAAVSEMGGVWASKQFGQIICSSVIVPSHPQAGATTCGIDRESLFFGDGFDNATAASTSSLSFSIRVTGGPAGRPFPMESVRALMQKALGRMP